MAARGAMQFCRNKGIFNENQKKWITEQCAYVNKAADEYGT